MDPNQALTLLLGPLGLTVGALGVVYLLVTEKIVPFGRLKAALDREVEAKQAAKDALVLVDSSNKAMERLSDAVEARNKLETERMQMQDQRLEEMLRRRSTRTPRVRQ
jgi:enterochelin esterase-like enzyme